MRIKSLLPSVVALHAATGCEGSITLPLKEKIYINIVDTILPELLENGGCYTLNNPCCLVPSFTPTNSLSVTPTQTPTITPTNTKTPTPTPTPTSTL